MAKCLNKLFNFLQKRKISAMIEQFLLQPANANVQLRQKILCSIVEMHGENVMFFSVLKHF